MFIGHFGVGFAAKRLAPRASLGRRSGAGLWGHGADRPASCSASRPSLGDQPAAASGPCARIAHERACNARPNPSAGRRLGAGLRQPADGHLVRDDPQPAAAVPGRHARRQRAGGRHHRGHRRGDGADRRRCSPARSATTWAGARAWPCSATRWGPSPSRCSRWPRGVGAVRRRALHRPRRQGHPRRAARRAAGRHHAAGASAARPSGCASRSTRSAPSSGRCWPPALMLLWANDFRAVFWVAVIPALLAVALLVVGVREPPRARGRAARRTRSAAKRWRGSAPPTGGWSASARSSRWRASARPSWCCARRRSASPRRWVPLVMVAMNVVYAASRLPVRQAVRLDEPPQAAGARAASC